MSTPKYDNLFMIKRLEHSPFAIQSINVNVPPEANYSKSVRVLIPKHSDLLSCGYLKVDLSDTFDKWGTNILYHLIKKISISFNELVFAEYSSNDISYFIESYKTPETRKMYIKQNVSFIPLHFWFNQNSENALPLLSLYQTDIYINIEFGSIEDIVSDLESEIPRFPDCILIFDYVYLHDQERQRFLQNTLEYICHGRVFLGEFDFNDKIQIININSYVVTNIEIEFICLDSLTEVEALEYLKKYTITISKNPWIIGPYNLHFLRFVHSYSYKSSISSRLIFNITFSLDDNNLTPSGFIKLEDEWQFNISTDRPDVDIVLESKLKYRINLNVLNKMFISDGKLNEISMYTTPSYSTLVPDESS